MRVPKFTKRVTRDSILFAFGIIGVTYEAVFMGAERPTLLILYAGCLGFPVFLRTDEKHNDPPPPPVPVPADEETP